MSSPPTMRTALIVHGIGLLAAGAGVLTYWALGSGSEEGQVFYIVGLVSGLVAIGWSIALALRFIGARGEGDANLREFRKRRLRAAVLISIALAELYTPAWLAGNWVIRMQFFSNRVDEMWLGIIAESGYSVLAPVAIVLLILALTAGLAWRSQKAWLRAGVLTVTGLVAAFTLFIVLPCQLWILGAELARTNPHANWIEFMNVALPDGLKTTTEKCCAAGYIPDSYQARLAICQYGQLPVQTLQQNLSENTSIAYASWQGLSTHPADRSRIALDAVQNRIKVSGELRVFCVNTVLLNLTIDELEELISHFERVAPEMQRELMLRFYQQFSCEAMSATHDDIEWKKNEIYYAWSMSNEPKSEGFEIQFLSFAKDPDPIVRRLAIHAWALTCHEKLVATPSWTAKDATGNVPRVTLEETEEAAQVFETAAKKRTSSETEGLLISMDSFLGYNVAWSWFQTSYPSDAARYAKDSVTRGIEPYVNRYPQRTFGQFGTAQDVHTELSAWTQRKASIDSEVLLNIVAGIVAGQRTEFTEDIKALLVSVNGKPPAPAMQTALEGALCGLLTPHEVEVQFEPWLNGDEGAAGLIRAATLLWNVHDEAQRLKLARRMMSLKDPGQRQIVFLHAKTLDPLSLNDPKLRMAWADTMAALLDDPDILVRRAAAYAVANYYGFRFSAMPRLSTGSIAGSEEDVLGPSSGQTESAREKEEMDGLRQKIAANRLLKANRSTRGASHFSANH